MTDQDFDEFAELFGQVAVALPMPSGQASDPTVLERKADVYFEALRDLPLSAVRASTRTLLRSGSGFFPSTQEWYQQADTIAFDALVSSRPTFPAGTSRPTFPTDTDQSAFEKVRADREAFLAALRAKPNKRPWINYQAVADVVERVAQRRTPVRPTTWCDDCQDVGMVKRVCRHLERCAAHTDVDEDWGEHDHVTRCSCVPANPVIQRRQELRRRA